MPAAVIIALVQAFGPAAIELIDLYMKDRNAVITPEMWDALKKHIPFSDLAGPK